MLKKAHLDTMAQVTIPHQGLNAINAINVGDREATMTRMTNMIDRKEVA